MLQCMHVVTKKDNREKLEPGSSSFKAHCYKKHLKKLTADFEPRILSCIYKRSFVCSFS